MWKMVGGKVRREGEQEDKIRMEGEEQAGARSVYTTDDVRSASENK